MPATVAAGDLLVSEWGWFANVTTTTPTDWAVIQARSGTNPNLAIYGKDAVGDEDGASVNHATSANSKGRAHVLRTLAAEWHGTLNVGTSGVFVGTPATGDSANSNPPAVTPAPGSNDYRFCAMAVHEDDLTTSGYPTNYADNQTSGNSGTAGSDCHLQLATRALTGTTDNPGTFTVEAGTTWVANTIAIEPPAAVGGVTVKTLAALGVG